MRPVREITAEEENYRTVNFAKNMYTSKRDPVEPEPVGTIILMAFRITGYDPDCDGSLMARLENINSEGEASGWTTDSHGLYPGSEVVVTQEELTQLFKQPSP